MYISGKFAGTPEITYFNSPELSKKKGKETPLLN
jgi:hypothetical protein